MAADEAVVLFEFRQFGQSIHAYKVSRNSS
jgi:hypothetical protein